MVMARPHTLADPEKCKQVAELFTAGCSRQEIADIMGVSDLDTITRWRRDPRVKTIVMKLIEDRVLEVTRKVDAKIAAILQQDDLSVKELLAIRKEFLAGSLRAKTENVDEDTISEAMDAIEEGGQDFVDKVEDIFRRNTADAKA